MLDCDTDTEIYFPPRKPSPDIREEFQEGLLWEYTISSEEVGYKNEIRHEVHEIRKVVYHDVPRLILAFLDQVERLDIEHRPNQ